MGPDLTVSIHQLPDRYQDLLLDPARSADGVRLALGMISSIDGAIALGPSSGGLGGPADREALPAIRDAADVVMVGATTLRTEGYRTIGGSAERRARRERKNLAPRARLAVVTATGDLPPDHPLLGDRDHRAIVVTLAAAHERVRQGLDRHGYLGTVDVVLAGDTHLEATLLRRGLRELGAPRILCEGGPTLAGVLAEQDAIDEVFLTLAPLLVGGAGGRMLSGAGEHLRMLRLVSSRAVGDELLLHYERDERLPETDRGEGY